MPFKVLGREVEILNVLQALAELRDMIILSVSVELAGDCLKWLNTVLARSAVFCNSQHSF